MVVSDSENYFLYTCIAIFDVLDNFSNLNLIKIYEKGKHHRNMFQQHHHFLHVLNQTFIIKNLEMNESCFYRYKGNVLKRNSFWIRS